MAGSERLSRTSLSSVGPGGGRHRRSAARSYAETISRSSAAADLDFSALEELLGDLDLVFAEYAPDIAENAPPHHLLRICAASPQLFPWDEIEYNRCALQLSTRTGLDEIHSLFSFMSMGQAEDIPEIYTLTPEMHVRASSIRETPRLFYTRCGSPRLASCRAL